MSTLKGPSVAHIFKPWDTMARIITMSIPVCKAQAGGLQDKLCPSYQTLRVQEPQIIGF